jgi:RNA polymerase sigma factor (TIGR02999 family)
MADETAGDPEVPSGVPGTVEDLVPLVYQELRAVARRQRWRVSGVDTLNTTALIHEAYLRLSPESNFGSRGHFLRVAAVAMRCVLVDRVRAQLAAKRGGGAVHVELDGAVGFLVEDEETVLAVHDALERLGALSPPLAQVVECRFFAGYNEQETAEVLGLSERTVQRHWATARAWLKKELQV